MESEIDVFSIISPSYKAVNIVRNLSEIFTLPNYFLDYTCGYKFLRKYDKLFFKNNFLRELIVRQKFSNVTYIVMKINCSNNRKNDHHVSVFIKFPWKNGEIKKYTFICREDTRYLETDIKLFDGNNLISEFIYKGFIEKRITLPKKFQKYTYIILFEFLDYKINASFKRDVKESSFIVKIYRVLFEKFKIPHKPNLKGFVYDRMWIDEFEKFLISTKQKFIKCHAVKNGEKKFLLSFRDNEGTCINFSIERMDDFISCVKFNEMRIMFDFILENYFFTYSDDENYFLISCEEIYVIEGEKKFTLVY
jgi:hypothetical protein